MLKQKNYDKQKEMKDFILATTLFIGLSASLWVMISDELNRPDVYKSWSSKECIKVKHSKTHSCENMPKKYNTVWMQ